MMSSENTPCSYTAASSPLKNKTTGSEIAVAALLGPTAAGKSTLALRLAHELECEIISCDSRQIYRGMDIGTAKMTETMREGITHWLIDCIDPDEEYSAFRFAREAEAIIRERSAAGKKLLVCGGTGLYYKALSDGGNELQPSDPAVRAELTGFVRENGGAALYEELRRVDPVYAAKIHVNDHQRIIRALTVFRSTGMPFSESYPTNRPPSGMHFSVFTLQVPRDLLYERINARVDVMMKYGLYREFLALREKGYHERSPGMQTVGYRELFAVERENMPLSGAADAIRQSTRHYAKRQITWFSTQTHGTVIDHELDFGTVCSVFRKALAAV